MKKSKLSAVFLTACMAATLLAGCGDKKTETTTELSNMVQVIENMLSNSNEQNQVVNDTAKNFEEITAKVASVSEASTKLQELVNNLNIANQQVISGIETISAVTEEVTAHSNETVEISEKNSDIADEVEAIVTTLNQLAEELSDAK